MGNVNYFLISAQKNEEESDSVCSFFFMTGNIKTSLTKLAIFSSLFNTEQLDGFM